MNGSTPTLAAVPSREDITRDAEASCATPLALMFVASLAWLVVSALFALVTSVKLHSPAILANCEWLTYGHTRPIANDTFVYGFASQAGLAVALWLLCRLGRTLLFGPLAVTIAAAFWNVGLLLSVFGILRGDTTGFDWIEFPSYGSATMFASYVVLAICALVTFGRRTTESLYPSQWYILGALFWLPWVYSTARLLLVWYPVRGAMQFLISAWFANGLLTLWLGALGLAVLYYFIPKLGNGQLSSRPLATFGFWTFALFAPWAGLYRGLPLPSWIVSVSIAASVLTLVPLLANAMNLWHSRQIPAASCSRIWFTTSLVFMVISGIMAPMVALCPISALTMVAESMLVVTLYGFVGFALFGAIYYIAPRVFGATGDCGSRGKLTWRCTLAGIVLFSGPLLIGGLVQGHYLRDSSVAFIDVVNKLKPFLRISTLGLLLLLIGNAAIFGGVISMVRDCCRRCCWPAETAPKAKLKPAKAR